MNRNVLTLLVLLSASTLAAQAQVGSGLEKLKELVGSWKGTTPDGQSVTVSYKSVSNDKSIMETLDMGGHTESMITVYHLDKGNAMLTHYCSMGNQPRMVLDRRKSTPTALAFAFLDATNLKSTKDPHMHDLTIVFKDKDHFAQEWTMRANGKDKHETFNFERVD